MRLLSRPLGKNDKQCYEVLRYDIYTALVVAAADKGDIDEHDGGGDEDDDDDGDRC